MVLVKMSILITSVNFETEVAEREQVDERAAQPQRSVYAGLSMVVNSAQISLIFVIYLD